jgi:uncharacterized membrane protein
VGLTLRPVRQRLVRGLGETGFIVVYSVFAILTFAALVHYVALHRSGDSQAWFFASIPPVRGALIALSLAGFSLFITAALVYPRLPMATFRHRVMPVRGVQQITRHPFFSGIAMWATAHALLALSTATFVFFLGMILLAFAGGMHQDRRLIQEMGEPYGAYVAATSFWPLVAVVTKRQKIAWREQPWLGYGAGVAASLSLYQVHDHIFDRGGAYVIVVVSVGSVVAILQAKLMNSRRPAT